VNMTTGEVIDSAASTVGGEQSYMDPNPEDDAWVAGAESA